MRGRAAFAASVIAVGLLALAGMADACSFCGAARREASVAYVVSAAAMGLMPIAFGTGLVLWLRRKYRRAAENERAGEDSSAPRA